MGPLGCEPCLSALVSSQLIGAKGVVQVQVQVGMDTATSVPKAIVIYDGKTMCLACYIRLSRK